MLSLEKSTFAKMFEAAELCRERALDVPMLVLIYTAMDTLAWALYADKTQGVRERFVALCENYILPRGGIQCTGLELYSARCSILHTLGWESDLSKSGKARSIFYSFGADDPTLAQVALELIHPGKFVSLRPDELLVALRAVVAQVVTLASTDNELAARLSVAVGKQYRSIGMTAGNQMFAAYIEKVQGDEHT